MRICGMNLFVLVNFVLSFLIFAFGCRSYLKTKNKAPFYIGVAFGLFSLSHLMSLVGIQRDFRDTVILIRAFSYFIVLTTLYHMGRKSV
ncbi:MAG: hypothetical protein V1927_04370 [Candidatus Omnitrophota bacterium]